MHVHKTLKFMSGFWNGSLFGMNFSIPNPYHFSFQELEYEKSSSLFFNPESDFYEYQIVLKFIKKQ